MRWEVRGKHFHESTLVSSLQSAIHVTIEFPLIFGETNFVEVPKIHEIHKICSPRQKVLYSMLIPTGISFRTYKTSVYWTKIHMTNYKSSIDLELYTATYLEHLEHLVDLERLYYLVHLDYLVDLECLYHLEHLERLYHLDHPFVL